MMKTATEHKLDIDRLDDGDWLHRLLADIQEDVAGHPSPRAVERIRGRLLAEMKRPARAAA